MYIIEHLACFIRRFSVASNAIQTIDNKGSVTYRFCPRETSYGRSSGDPPPTLETSRTFFDTAEAPDALFIVQALRLSAVYIVLGARPGPENEHTNIL